MKKFCILLMTIVIICLITITVVNANDQVNELLASYKKELTGDSQPEKINIIRKKSKKIEITILTATNKKYKIPIPGELRPIISFNDLNQDRVKDILLEIPGNKNEPAPTYRIYSANNDQLKRIALPKELALTAQFENDYKASIQIYEVGKKYTIDLKDRKTNFDQRGLFQKGLLNEPTELNVHSFDLLRPVRFMDLAVGLKGRQVIDEGYNGEIIAIVCPTWKWVKNEWKLQQVEVRQVNKK